MKPHAGIPVTDIRHSAEFYERLGFSFVRTIERPEWKLQIMFLDHPSGFALELLQHPDNTSVVHPTVPEVLHVAVPVDNVRTIVEQLERDGVKIIRQPTPGITVKTIAFVADPDGFSVELYEE